MSEVHRFSVVKMLSEAGNKISYDPHGPEIVMAKDYDALAAEAQALREEVAALRARVVVVPEPLNEGDARRECGEYEVAMQRGYNACLRELARINGLTVSEGLLRRIVTPALTSSDAQDRIGALEELSALLSEQE
ncbi:TPA: hypothetical protein ACVGM8_002303 [Pseudomonas aeruginosa]|nr:hypothetical protein [Pseudomonas aeruginosa]MBI7114141.1 hypothetical protein [Pseudomonas aeruginosa]MBI8198057.1 hypothetical protein [Pseudomonas aeruginosa]MCT5957585.1 hypothetical protein [Pseudomonas aeruginosa]MCV4065758.1 hypothetical protein [Pseudomonas aeruginosa]HCF0786718.1 hypothetical protein [Pseudomonas aeruginosa]